MSENVCMNVCMHVEMCLKGSVFMCGYVHVYVRK